MKLARIPGVFSPRSDSWMLAHAVDNETLAPGASVLDLCCGSGLLAITAALRGARATAVDASRRAVFATGLNARLNGTRVRARRGALYEPVAGERFDLIVSNPPYLPSPSDRLPRRGRARAWDAGPDGRTLLDPIIAGAPGHLRPGGTLLLVHSSINGEAATMEALRAAGLTPDVLERRRGPVGPLMAARVSDREEEVLVIRGRAPQSLFPAKSGMNARTPLAAATGTEIRFTQTRS